MTESEKFAGALETYSIEAMMQDQRALQAGTSHNLGQNFAKAFDVTYQDAEGQLQHVWASSTFKTLSMWENATSLKKGFLMKCMPS